MTREVCWDLQMTQSVRDVELRMHRPVRKNTVITLDKPWEGMSCGYLSLIKLGDVYRMYYNACGETVTDDSVNQKEIFKRISVCMAESRDGKTFTRPALCRFGPEPDNNKVFMDENDFIDNFSVFYDENPACPKEEKFKALRRLEAAAGPRYGFEAGDPYTGMKMAYYSSEDGLSFTFRRILPLHGRFDSFNVTFWDPVSEQYFIYYRDLFKYTEDMNVQGAYEGFVRDVMVATSRDFVNWEEHGRVRFDNTDVECHLYVSGVAKYYRSDRIFWGLPVRYFDRVADLENFRQMPFRTGNRLEMIEKYDRCFSAVTDNLFITSRDGLHFERKDEAFCTPGYENGINWIYGDCFFAYDVFETESDFPGEPNELSLYCGLGSRVVPLQIVRYTLRLDGFASWHAGFSGGEVLTKPLTVDGGRLSLNFETSALGHVAVTVCDASGSPLEGYASGLNFGSSVDRTVTFPKPLEALAGREVCLRFDMKDAELYSYAFTD